MFSGETESLRIHFWKNVLLHLSRSISTVQITRLFRSHLHSEVLSQSDYPLRWMKFVEWKHFAIFISLLLITLMHTYEETVPRTVKSILSEELKTHDFKNKKQKISEHSSDVLNAIVLQTVDYAGSSTNIQNNHRGREFFLKLVGTSQNWPK